MINFHKIEFKRLILHQIVAKNDSLEHGTIIADESLFRYSEQVIKLITERLSKASQKTNKAFEMLISEFYSDSFFGLIHNVDKKSDEEFIHTSIKLANKLAQSQRVNTIPGGYFLVVDALDEFKNPLPLAIKAELHGGLRYEIHNRESTIKFIDDIFLDTASRKFKFATIQRRKEELPNFDFPNNIWRAFMYDEQYSVDSQPAEYFYKDFLGYSVESNSKIQSKRFYDATDDFIKTYVETSDEKDSLLKLLKHEFKINEEPEIKPNEFANAYFHDSEIRDIYMNDIIPYLPTTIEKDVSLIKSKLEKRKITFPNDIMLTGPDKTFDYSVEIVNSETQLDKIELGSGDYTILKIKGKPYQK